jgi:succinyl-diaminopimelate desuccinylase
MDRAGRATVTEESAALREELASSLLELASIRSVSRQERDLADFLERRLRAKPALAVTRVGDNLVATLPSLQAAAASPSRPRLLLCGHLDTVPENQNLPPRRDGDTIHGLGTTDLKSGLAVLLMLLDELADVASRAATEPAAATLAKNLRCDPLFVLYAREEVAYAESGLVELERALPELRQVAFAVCVEPTANAVELGCNGTLHAEVTVRGKAAHAARPWLGVNAIHAALPILESIARRGERRWSPPGRPDVEYREVVSVTGIRGGKARNVVPDDCVFNVNFRYAPDRTPDEARAEIAKLVQSARGTSATNLASAAAEVVFKDVAPSGRVASGNALCERLIALAKTVRAKQAWTDVGRFTSWGVDAVSCGPGFPEFAHQQAEHASVAKMVESLAIFRALVGLTDAAP